MISPIDRRHFLKSLAAAGACATASPVFAETYYMNLGRIAHDAGILFGSALGSPYFSDSSYASLFDETRLLVSEWQFKIASLRPTRDTYDFYNADRLVALGRAQNKPVKAHCLFWQNANPTWMMGLSTLELRKLFDEHIEKVVPRYAGKVYAWDVVNEPFWPADGQAGGFGKGPWYQAFGQDWPLRAFKRISTLDRNAKFALNESQCDNTVAGLGATIRPALLKLVDTLQQAGATLHAVGLESHLDMGQSYDDGVFADFIDQLSRRKVEVWISELDVRDFTLPDDVATRDGMIADRVTAFLVKALASRAVTQVATWGLSDKYSWLDDLWTQRNGNTVRQPRPLPFDANMRRKPMWSAMTKAFEARKKKV
jgi:endo-1,4-beta-xylanase